MAHILIIDDSVSALELMSAAAMKDGHTITALTSAPRDISTMASGLFDLVVTDLYMPDHDGVEVIRELRASAPHIPILAVSGKRGGLELLHIAKFLGATAILAKPFSADRFVASLRAVLKRKLTQPA